MQNLANTDPAVYDAIQSELRRQQTKIELIASENFVSQAVLEAQGSVLNNKYAEGYPGKRYYGGCEYVDIVEKLAIERAKKLFQAEAVNVQPHSGAQANFAVYFALLNPGDKILGMDLSHGGHLTHGMKINVSGKWLKAESYQVEPDSYILDYDRVRERAHAVLKMIVAGASAIRARWILPVDEVGAYLFVDMAHIAGLVAAGVHPSPIPYADVVTTTTHKTLRGPRGGMIFSKKKWAKKINSAVFPGTQGGPLMHVIAAKAVALKEALEPSFVTYQKQIVANARALAEALARRGLRIISGGTDTHLLLVDLRGTGVSGKELQERLDSVNITCNMNSIPFDTESPTITSGIRLGTPAVTTRGFNEEDMDEIADLIVLAVHDIDGKRDEIMRRVDVLCSRHPLYTDLG